MMTDGGRRLEEALKKAITDPEARIDFYRLLMASKVYVAGEKESKGANGGEPHTHIKQWTQKDGSLAMPFFATSGSLKETLGENESYVLIPVIDLFKMAGEATLVMTTPDGAKDFKPPEVASILASLVPKDRLSAALQKAMQNPGDRPAFYNALINAKVYALGGEGETPEEGRTEEKRLKLTAGDKLSFAAWTHPALEGPAAPFFSSLELLNRAAGQEGAPYMTFLGMDFLKMAVGFGRPLILNPGYEFSHLFSAEEVEHIIKASKTASALKPGLKVRFSQPENY
ncbi:MAG: SseB family protein, partial [Candidatus Adiutrix sp.]|nr:SseB family protein [Candidatus Adiutrix sp.]